MAQLDADANRLDPYKNYRFRVRWEGRHVAGFSKVGALERTIEVVTHREGGDASSRRESPGCGAYEPITLERGVTHDPDFERWVNEGWNYDSGSFEGFRKDVFLEMLNDAGQLALAYKVFRCWVSEFRELPELDANANAVSIETLRLENEGWERDQSVGEPGASS